jgi:hypothetical protein
MGGDFLRTAEARHPNARPLDVRPGGAPDYIDRQRAATYALLSGTGISV